MKAVLKNQNVGATSEAEKKTREEGRGTVATKLGLPPKLFPLKVIFLPPPKVEWEGVWTGKSAKGKKYGWEMPPMAAAGGFLSCEKKTGKKGSESVAEGYLAMVNRNRLPGPGAGGELESPKNGGGLCPSLDVASQPRIAPGGGKVWGEGG